MALAGIELREKITINNWINRISLMKTEYYLTKIRNSWVKCKIVIIDLKFVDLSIVMDLEMNITDKRYYL